MPARAPKATPCPVVPGAEAVQPLLEPPLVPPPLPPPPPLLAFDVPEPDPLEKPPLPDAPGVPPPSTLACAWPGVPVPTTPQPL